MVKNPACQCRRCERRGFDPWVRKIPMEKGLKESDMSEATYYTHTDTHTLTADSVPPLPPTLASAPGDGGPPLPGWRKTGLTVEMKVFCFA